MKKPGKINHNYLSRFIDEIHSLDELRGKIESGRQLKIKFGVDLTAPDLHLGHAVNLRVMRHFQEQGHKVQLLLGDLTTEIGDPTGRIKTRPQLSKDEIKRNGETFLNQIGLILLTNDTVFEVMRNSDWFNKMPISKFLSIMGLITTARLEARETYRKRKMNGDEVRLNELIYPLIQAWDSVEMESDVAPVGTDQLFNEMLGRDLQEKFGLEKQVVITTKITPGLCGKIKQSKSLGNYVGLTDTARDKFGKVMTLPDELIAQWLEVYTDMKMLDVIGIGEALANGEMSHRDAKLMLAREIVKTYHGEDAAISEEKWFIETFSKGNVPDDIPIISMNDSFVLIDILKMARPGKSNSIYRRLCASGGVRIGQLSDKTADFKKLTDPYKRLESSDDLIIRIGPKDFFRLKQK